jgi:hypothetical protein
MYVLLILLAGNVGGVLPQVTWHLDLQSCQNDSMLEHRRILARGASVEHMSCSRANLPRLPTTGAIFVDCTGRGEELECPVFPR